MKKSQSEAESLEVPSTVNGTSSCSKIEVLESDVHKDDSSIKKKKKKERKCTHSRKREHSESTLLCFLFYQTPSLLGGATHIEGRSTPSVH
jgi:hypothetical protein